MGWGVDLSLFPVHTLSIYSQFVVFLLTSVPCDGDILVTFCKCMFIYFSIRMYIHIHKLKDAAFQPHRRCSGTLSFHWTRSHRASCRCLLLAKNSYSDLTILSLILLITMMRDSNRLLPADLTSTSFPDQAVDQAGESQSETAPHISQSD